MYRNIASIATFKGLSSDVRRNYAHVVNRGPTRTRRRTRTQAEAAVKIERMSAHPYGQRLPCLLAI